MNENREHRRGQYRMASQASSVGGEGNVGPSRRSKADWGLSSLGHMAPMEQRDGRCEEVSEAQESC